MTPYTTPHPENAKLLQLLLDVDWPHWAERLRKQGGKLVAPSEVRAYALQRLFALNAEAMLDWLADSRRVDAFVAIEPTTVITMESLSHIEARFAQFGLASALMTELHHVTSAFQPVTALCFDLRVIASPAPLSKTTQLKRLLPQIERFRADGIDHQAIVAALNRQGLILTNDTYRNTLKRVRAHLRRGKSAMPSSGKAIRLPQHNPVPTSGVILNEPKGTPISW